MAQKKSGKDRDKKSASKKADSKKAATSKKTDSKKAATEKGRKSKVKGSKVETAATRPSPLPAPRPVTVDRPATPAPPAARPTTARQAFRAPAGATTADLATDHAGYGPTEEKAAVKATEALAKKLSTLQERLQAQGAEGNRERVLVILQGMDTSGKDGVTKTVFDATNPLGLHLASFKKPTAEELAHDFLWRIEKQVPEAGEIGVFNRSQYEDVLVVRVHDLVPREVWSKRYAAINAFERRLARQGVTVVKCFLHVSKATQQQRLLARLDDSEKWWKYNPGDVDERAHWDAYQDAYTEVLRRCHTVGAPWYVIPADDKWYRNWAVAALLTEILTELDPQFPPADFDVEAEKKRVAQS